MKKKKRPPKKSFECSLLIFYLVEISKKYNVNTKNVCRIVHNQTWKHIPNTIEELDKLIGA